jgi:hypothetical protein
VHRVRELAGNNGQNLIFKQVWWWSPV